MESKGGASRISTPILPRICSVKAGVISMGEVSVGPREKVKTQEVSPSLDARIASPITD